jgi:ABC-type maltose transport system permease subunit
MRKRHEKNSVRYLSNWFRILAAVARAPIASVTRKHTLHLLLLLQQFARTVALILPSS